MAKHEEEFEVYHAAIVLDGHPQDKPSLLAQHPTRSNEYHWSGGKTYFITLSDKLDIHKTYLRSDFEDLDALELQFRKDFPVQPMPEPKDDAGWLAPDGKFYECSASQHEGLAGWLAPQHTGELGWSSTLEKLGWLRIDDDGMIYNVYDNKHSDITQAQLDTLHMMAQEAEEVRPSYSKKLLMYLEYFEVRS